MEITGSIEILQTSAVLKIEKCWAKYWRCEGLLSQNSQRNALDILHLNMENRSRKIFLLILMLLLIIFFFFPIITLVDTTQQIKKMTYIIPFGTADVVLFSISLFSLSCVICLFIFSVHLKNSFLSLSVGLL